MRRGASCPIHQRAAAIALTAAAVKGLPPIAHSPLPVSWTRTQVTWRMASPSMAPMASVTFSILAFFLLRREHAFDQLDIDEGHELLL